jgi:ribosomal protein L7/L12
MNEQDFLRRLADIKKKQLELHDAKIALVREFVKDKPMDIAVQDLLLSTESIIPACIYVRDLLDIGLAEAKRFVDKMVCDLKELNSDEV